MTEAEWLGCSDPTAMLNFLAGKASHRKLWLFACGCCRRHSILLADVRCRTAVETGERYADGIASSYELAEASEEAFCRRADLGQSGGILEAMAMAAAFAVIDPADRDPNLPALTVAESVKFTSAEVLNVAQLAGTTNDEVAAQCHLLRDIFGFIFRPVTVDPRWQTSTVVDLADAIYHERAFDRMQILADALMDAGCDSESIITHCRQLTEHVRGCWVVDLLLAKE